MLPAEEEIFYQSAEFWVGMAFILVMGALFFPLVKVTKSLIEKRINRIKNELQEAETLKIDAQKLYAEYERKLINCDAEVATIISQEEAVITEEKQRREAELCRLLKQKQNEADSKMEIASEKINAELKKEISDRTMEILQSVIKKNLTKNDYNSLIEKSINNIKNMNW